VQINYTPNEMTLVIKAGVFLIMFCEWAFLFLWCPSLFRESRSLKAKLALRPLVALGMIAVVLLQSRLYHASVTSQTASSQQFLPDIYILEHIVSLLLVFRAVFKVRSEQQKAGLGQTSKI
jgi:hypothetical protein